MLLLSLIIYLVLLFPVNWIFAVLLFPVNSHGLHVPVTAAVSVLTSFLIVYFIHSYNPEWKGFFRDMFRVEGARMFALLSGLAAVAMILIGGTPDLAQFLLPVAIVSFINAAKGDFFPDMLKEDEVPAVAVISEPDPQEITADKAREFRWEHNNHEYRLKLLIRDSIYKDFASRSRVDKKEWSREYVTDGICGEVRTLADELMRLGRPYGTYEEVGLVLSFVQHVIKYTKDKNGEWPKYPVETLYEEAGDCEDCTMLGAAILKTMGYDVALLFVPGHMALGVAGAEGIPGTSIEHKDRRYYYCEMTAEGWKIGEIPEDYENENISVQPVSGITFRMETETQT